MGKHHAKSDDVTDSKHAATFTTSVDFLDERPDLFKNTCAVFLQSNAEYWAGQWSSKNLHQPVPRYPVCPSRKLRTQRVCCCSTVQLCRAQQCPSVRATQCALRRLQHLFALQSVVGCRRIGLLLVMHRATSLVELKFPLNHLRDLGVQDLTSIYIFSTTTHVSARLC